MIAPLCRLLTICRAVGDRGRWEFGPITDFGRSPLHQKALDSNLNKTWCLFKFDLHSFDEFFGEEKFSWLPSKNKVTDFQRHTNFLIKLKCLDLELLLISFFVFRRQPAESLFSKFFLSNESRVSIRSTWPLNQV